MDLKGRIDLFVYESINIFEGTRVVLCEGCLNEMGHLENPFDVNELAELQHSVCSVCGHSHEDLPGLPLDF